MLLLSLDSLPERPAVDLANLYLVLCSTSASKNKSKKSILEFFLCFVNSFLAFLIIVYFIFQKSYLTYTTPCFTEGIADPHESCKNKNKTAP